MGQTVIEKIIAGHTSDAVSPGRIVWMDLDVRSARDFGGPNVVKNFEREYGGAAPADVRKTFFTFDLCAPACTLKYADNQQACRDFARKHGIQVYDVDQGIGSHVMIEAGHAGPGITVVGTDSHLNILGAVGCFGQGMGDVDIAFAFKTGRTWFEVPESVKVVLKGRPAPEAGAKDLTLFLCRELGTKKIALRSAEFYGEAVRELGLAGRITLCSMITEMAGIIGFIPEVGETYETDLATLGLPQLGISKKEKRSGANSVEKKGVSKTVVSVAKALANATIAADPDAEYAETIELDVTGLGRQVALPPSPNTVKPLSEVNGVCIDSGFIGSCTNGRTTDFVAAASVLKNRKVRKGVMLKIVPATRRVYEELLQNGVLAELFAAGAIVLNAGCGGCADGHAGLTGKGEVEISTGNRNFPGKQGKGPVYLASPAVVAASCVRGEICAPEDL